MGLLDFVLRVLEASAASGRESRLERERLIEATEKLTGEGDALYAEHRAALDSGQNEEATDLAAATLGKGSELLEAMEALARHLREEPPRNPALAAELEKAAQDGHEVLFEKLYGGSPG